MLRDLYSGMMTKSAWEWLSACERVSVLVLQHLRHLFQAFHMEFGRELASPGLSLAHPATAGLVVG